LWYVISTSPAGEKTDDAMCGRTGRSDEGDDGRTG
jgi:hypothetical protein